MGGFHSQGGWITFLFVTIGGIALSHRFDFFRAGPSSMPVHERTGAQVTLAYLAPIMALMAGGILGSAFSPHDQWSYAVKAAAVGAALWWFRHAYISLLTRVSATAIGVGLAIGILWVATDPEAGRQTAVATWLGTLPGLLAAVWLAVRVTTSVVLVPIAEELAFRGYLARVLIAARFETVSFGTFRLLAFLGSSLAFGIMHERWIAACLAGAAYALLMYRAKNLADPIAAHIASNATIMAWELSTGH
jgi:exosortase E/protease (VPEID-CTERM system)